VTNTVPLLLIGAYVAVVVALQCRHLRWIREQREDAQAETDLYRQRGGRAR